MNSKHISLSALKASLAMLLASLVISCGNEDEANQAGQILVSIDEVNWTLAPGACTGSYPPALSSYQRFTVSVLDADGIARPNTTILLTADLTGNTFPSFPVMWILDDINGNGPDLTDVVTDVGAVAPYVTETESNGAKDLWIELDFGGCTYSGSVYIFSGILTETVGFDVIN